MEKMVAHVNKPVYVCKNDSFVAVFPDLETRITCGIDFPQVQSLFHKLISCLCIDGY